MRSGWRILILSFVVSGLLISPAVNLPIVSAQSEEDELRRLYDNNELFEQLSGAARTMLEAKFGRKGGEVLEPSPEALAGAPEGALSGYVGNVPVNDPSLDLTARDTQSETTIVLFPTGVCVGYNDSGSFVPPGTPPGDKFTGFSRSTDGGASFTDKGTLPTSVGGDAGDPVLARDNVTGKIYFSTLRFSGSGIQVFRSDDDCDTFGPPVNAAPGKTGFQDKEWITVDNFSGPGQGNVYHVARDFGPGNGIFFFRSTDGGNTFSPNGGTLIASGSPVNVQGAFVTVGPDHAVYVFWFHQTTPQRILMRKSTDQGLTFGPPITLATLATTATNGGLGLTGRRDGTATFNPFRNNAFPHAAVNSDNGNIYVVFNDNPAGIDKGDVFFTQSTDGGQTWSARVRVNDDATTSDNWQPTVAVTPDGKHVGVFFYDRRLDAANNNLIDYFGRIGDISGAIVTFEPNFRITDESFPPEFGRDPVVNAVYMGDYDTAVADNSNFYVTWGDNRLPNPNVPTRVRQADVRFARIALQAQEENVNNFVSFNPNPATFQSTLDTTGCPASFAGKFSFDATLMNISSSSALTALKAQVAVLSGDNLLQNADGGPGGVGSRLTVPNTGGFSDGKLDPGESVDVPFIICLKQFDPFDFFVDVFGVVSSGGPYAANY